MVLLKESMLWMVSVDNGQQRSKNFIGFFSHRSSFVVCEIGQRVGYNNMIYSESEIDRIARVAGDVASKRGSKLCSSIGYACRSPDWWWCFHVLATFNSEQTYRSSDVTDNKKRNKT